MSTLIRSLLALLFAGGLASTGLAADSGYRLYRSAAAFEDVLDGLQAAIQERGLYINNVMDLGEMLTRTGKDLGMAEPIYGQARTLEFCSALLSRDMMREDPARIVNCPFTVSVYTRAGESGVTYVAHRAIPQAEQDASATMSKIARMLKDLSEAAISW